MITKKWALIFLGSLGGFAVGCGMDDSSRTTQTNEPSTTVTANRPALPETTRDPADRSSSTTPATPGTSVNDKTPFDQDENQRDINTTADIRKRIVNSDLSSKAHNVMITTQSGQVSLRGRVESQAEKDAVEKIAAEVAGADKVDSQLEIVTN
ncbi:BON domain-containing protein [Schlesneria sp. T3-172]|uniref:BON domain-containing protein n=1 Tax=Schlesneria TaxID=656899 RepID=UPI002F166B9A